MKCRKLLCLLVLVAICLAGCSGTQKQYTVTFLDLFDTVTTVTHLGGSQAQFDEDSKAIRAELERYHRLFDIYNDYPGLNNLKTVNDQAGIAPVVVDRVIIDLLLDCRSYHELTGGRVNAAMGSVLSLWHDARNDGINDPMNAQLPKAEKLEAALEHISFDALIIDEEASTVYLSDPEASLDVGAIAKGWATQRVAESAPEGILISVGGNVCATGPKNAEGTPWVIGIQDPDGDGNIHTIYVTGGSVVTSGDYQRVYYVDGVPYHHIIDPDTAMPASHWRSVTVVSADSGLADALSTALFLLPLEEGEALAAKCGAEVLWIDFEGNESMTPGFREMIRT